MFSLRQLFTAPVGRVNATRQTFFLTGFGFAIWSAIIPFMRTRLGIDESALGLLVLFLGGGSLVLMPFSGRFVVRWGVRRVLGAVLTLGMLMLPALSVVSDYWCAAFCILSMGALLGVADVSVTIQSVAVEKAECRPMISGFHALYSAGGFAGAGLVALQLALGIPIWAAVASLYLLSLALLFRALPSCLGKGEESSGDDSGSKSRRGVPAFIWTIAAFCFIMFLTEGSVLDWSGVYMRDVALAGPASASLAFSVYCAFQMLGRFAGNRLIEEFGRRRLLLGSCVLCMVSLGVLAAGVPVWAALAAYGTLGLAASNVVPILFWAVGNQKQMPVTAAASTVATCGYMGILAGPAGIGVVAEHWSLCAAYGIVACLTAFIAFNAKRVV